MVLINQADIKSAGGVALRVGTQEGLPPLFRKVLLEWLARFHVSPRGDLVDVLTLLAAEGRRQLRFGSLYRGYAAFGELG